MTVPEVLYSIILALISAVLSLILCTRRRDAAALFTFIQISWWTRWAFNYLNSQLQFFAQKDASEFSLSIIDQQGGIWALFNQGFLNAFLNLKFFIEALVNIPALRILEESVYILNMTNGFVGAVSGLLVFAYFKRMFDIRVATIGLILTSIYPAALAFSFFALRDIFMYFFTLLNVCSFAWIYLRNRTSLLNWFLYLFSFIANVACRTELILFLAVIPGWALLIWALDLLSKIRSRASKMFAVACLCLVIPSVSLATAYAGYTLAIRKLGFTSFVSPFDLVSDFDTAKSSRGVSETSGGNVFDGNGHGSDVLPPAVYARTPVPIRLTLQIIGIVVVPMPWLLTGISRWFAFADSVFVMAVLFWHCRSLRLFKTQREKHFSLIPRSILQYDRRKFYHFTLATILTFAIGAIGFGLIVTNGGNAFRMRLCLVPYSILGASLYVSASYAWVGGRFVSMKKYVVARLASAAGDRGAAAPAATD